MFNKLLTACQSAAVALCLAAGAFSADAAGYHSQGGKIFDAAGTEIQLRGISHFGFNATILQPQYLWAMGWKEQIAQIKSLGFNAVRVPYVPDTLYNRTPIDQLSYVDANRNPELLGKTPLQALDLWMAEADRQGLYILLDFHSVSMQRQYPFWFVSNPADFGLVYNGQAYPKESWIRDLVFVAQRYAKLPRFMGVDIYNEPNGIVRWAAGDVNMNNPIYYWKPAAEAAAAAVLAANANLMIFVQGINGNYDGIENTNIAMNWGEDFQPQNYQPLNIPADKLVLSPHTYGPDVYVKSSFSAADFPANLAAQWETLFGQFSQKIPVVVGEWGGRYGNGTGGQADVTWQNAFVDYLGSKGINSSFYWCYTPNSGDTGGILDDTLAVRQDKMALLKKHWAAGVVQPPTQPPGPVYTQPYIQTFAPQAGPVGTVVTLDGLGFSGATLASVGNLRNLPLTVISDGRVQVKIPAGVTSGAIGIFNPVHAAFTPVSFTVAGAVTGYVQQGIRSFSPASGPVGTVVTVKGSGFKGSTLAYLGAARDIALTVLDDGQARFTVPPGATNGAVAVVSPGFTAFSPTWFTVK